MVVTNHLLTRMILQVHREVIQFDPIWLIVLGLKPQCYPHVINSSTDPQDKRLRLRPVCQTGDKVEDPPCPTVRN